MTSQPNGSPLRRRMIDDQRMRQLSPKTQANYQRTTLHEAELMARMQPVRVPRTLPVVLRPQGVGG